MKTKVLPLILFAAAPFAFAQEETPTYTDLYYASDMNIDPWGNTNPPRHMCKPAAWKIGSLEGETLTTTPNSKYNNLFFVGALNVSRTTPTGYDYTNWEVNNVTIDVTNGFQYSIIQVCGGGQNFKVNGNVDASIHNNKDWNNTSTQIELQGISSLDIMGNLYINNTTDPTTRIDTANADGRYNGIYHHNGIYFGVAGAVSGTYTDTDGDGTKETLTNATCDNSFTLYGDVIMSDNDMISNYKPWGATYANSRITLRLDTTRSAIKGIVYLNESYEGERVLDLASLKLSSATSIGITFDELSREFAGLSGSSALVASVARKKTIDLIFTNSTKQDWTGSLTAGDAGTEINLLMDAQSADGKQAMLIKKTHKGEAANKIAFKTVNVAYGTLELGGYDELTHGALTISNNKAKLVVGGVEKDTLGAINFTSAFVSAGTIGIGFNQESSDVLNIVKGESEEANGTFYVADPSAFAIELDYLPVEDSVLKEQLESEGSFTYDIITFDSTNLTAETLSNITVKVVDQYGNAINGVEAILGLLGEEGAYTGISATIQTAVPEPATVAGIAGMLALAFVAYRRRK